ncbi:DNA repair protein RecN [Metabacillus niabensis]|uniref:DNA repair protein RecN n=1 Tax=Metabacillus niabensis TaxID=324854 RepID=A0ABT9YY97_9BACI|nr:DNA repair protein RecN [Metabacillus niabensis]MDQ0224963.1 DNA repair protein RecN (Recombination protein N) [Metabacillus niabensis]
MLAELSIKNFAIIESLSISFEKGLTVLTGETGAGKSIIIDAIHLLAGGRGSAEFIRYGEKRAELEGLFLIDELDHPVYTKCEELGIDVNDGMIILRRDLTTSGKSICRINGKLVTIAILREVGQYLVDIHGQHDNQELMNDENHLKLLDQYGGQKITKALEGYLEIYKQYDALRKKITQLSENEQEMAHRLDLLQFQLDEITNANLQPKEDELLQEEKIQISNFEKIYESLNNSYNSLHGEHRGLDWVGHAMSNLEEIASINSNLKELSEVVSNAYYQLEDLSYQVRNELESLEFDPERLNYVESRLNEINHLKRKYGQSVEEILIYSAKIEEELDTIKNRDNHLSKLQKELDSVLKDLVLEANNLTIIRKKLANVLTEEIHKELKELYMDKTTFEVKFITKPLSDTEQKFTSTGIDNVEFYLSTNPGEPLKPLNKTASGGELSRIMLAMKSIFSQHQGITSIIFDEVDTGVSGRVAQAIAEKIYRVSNGSQVLCITHLPQVAAMADTHLYIAKEIKDGRTKTSVKPLEETEKIKEIGRMIAGAQVTELSKEHAKELLELANTSKR